MTAKINCGKELEMFPIEKIVPNAKNPNHHSDEQIDRLCKIIEYQGFRDPLIISNLSGTLISGHGRLLAAKKLGMKEVPVLFQDFADEDMEYAAIVSENSVASWAELDLSMINAKLADFDPSFDIDLLGIKNFVLEPADKNGDADAVPDAPKVAKTKRGELWTLGNHRLLIDDCTVKENVERLMNGEKAGMVFTDPPYNHASNDDGVAASVSQSHRRLMESEWDKNFDIVPALASIDWIKAENSTVYICTSHHLAGKIFEWQAIASLHGSYCLWIKPNPMPSLMKRHWTWDHELICYSTYGKHVFNFPAEGHAPASWVIQKNQKNDLHPTMKPIEVPERAITHSSNPGQLVGDLFLGSGTTLIACEKTGRRCFGTEISEQYADVILSRFAKFSGKDPVREDGVKWSELNAGSDSTPNSEVPF